MDLPDIISTFVVLIFAYIIIKYRLIPRFAKRRAEKALEKTDSPAAPFAFPQYFPQAQPPDAKPPAGTITYCDVCFICVGKEDDAEAIPAAVNGMLLSLGKRGIAPSLGFCRVSEHCLMAYATYRL